MNEPKVNQLSPAQHQAFASLLDLIERKEPLIGLVSRNGLGRSTILRNIATHLAAPLITLPALLEKTHGLHPLHLEEGIAATFLEPLGQHDLVLIDDLHLLTDLLLNNPVRARPNLLPVVFQAILACLEGADKQLIIGLRDQAPEPLHQRTLYVKLPPFEPADFRFLFTALLGQRVDGLDFERIHRFARRLDGHQMRYVSRILPPDEPLETDGFLKFLETQALVSNVNTGQVEPVSLDSLYGVEEVIRSLEAEVIVPLERADLADQLGLQPKRGVLLYGPPGTGKTTIGRALAHRLHSKFFLIDGTVISGTPDFFFQIHRIFEGAKENAPSILFIDDSDLLFEDGAGMGLYRYLLTMLDGLESVENAQVTVMLTAMNIGSLPPALIRSGRIELWLPMELPDGAARAAILQAQLGRTPPQLRQVALEPVVAKSEGFTGADLKRLVTDAINLYGYDVAKEQEPRAPLAYFTEAIERLVKNRERLETAPAFTAAHHGAASRHQPGLAAAIAALQQFKMETGQM